MIELITTPFFMLCVLVIIALCVGIEIGVDNERNSLCIEMSDGRQIAVVQIAGLVARRIVCFVEKDQALQTGERFGLIRFGSRLDVYLPDGVEPEVAIGQTMVAGETVLADLQSREPVREGRTG